MSTPAIDPLAHRDQPAPARQVRVWTDPGRLDPDWAAPRARGRLPRWLTVGVPAMFVVLVLVLVGALGGFKQRQDRIIRVPATSTIVSGPYRLTFTSATATRNSDSDNKVTWDLVAYGTIQSTDPGSDSPDIGDSSFILAQAPTTHEVVNLYNVKIGARLGTSYDSGRATPGLPPVPVTWRFQFSQKFQPSEVLRLVVWHQSYYDNTLLQTGYESWNLDSTATEILLPVTVLPVTH